MCSRSSVARVASSCLCTSSARAEVERLRPGRVGGVEVAAPRLDDGERVEVREAEVHRAEAAGREADDRAARARGIVR